MTFNVTSFNNLILNRARVKRNNRREHKNKQNKEREHKNKENKEDKQQPKDKKCRDHRKAKSGRAVFRRRCDLNV